VFDRLTSTVSSILNFAYSPAYSESSIMFNNRKEANKIEINIF
jgi:hypothetical protein